MPVTPAGPLRPVNDVQGVLAGCLQAQEHRKSREWARRDTFGTESRWHGLRLPPITGA